MWDDVPLKFRSHPAGSVQCVTVGGVEHRFALPITLTPYVATQACSARCVFCSENLRRSGETRVASRLRPHGDYFGGLQQALAALRDLDLGISISGLEATDDLPWLESLVSTLQTAERARQQAFREKILYSNGAGLAEAGASASVLRALQAFGLQRIEWSRHSDRQAENDAIMRFHRGVAVADNRAFSASVARVQGMIPVVLVCVVQHGGVASAAQVEDYVRWAESLGVRQVVFREFARPGDGYRAGRTLDVIRSRRVDCEALVEAVLNERIGFEPVARTEGYYFRNWELNWSSRVQVVFEASDYAQMHARHASELIYKLVYHANGRLTSDWSPDRHILLKTHEH